MSRLVLGVAGMRCPGCERTVADAVRALPGVHGAEADLGAEEVDVRYDAGRTGPDEIASAVRAAGFATG